MSPPPDCDLFCRVIDNYGDIGVCWRLACQLHNEYGWRLRLWVDDPTACAQLTQGNVPNGIAIHHWTTEFPAIGPAAVVIEAFACELPDSYLASMAALDAKPVWLNLEYLCVEDWGPGFHLQPSPHPQLPLLKHFFVPGILPGTGGVLREHDLLDRHAHFNVEAARRRYANNTSGRWIFLFCYDNPTLLFLLDSWAQGTQPIHCLVSAGKANTQVAAWLGHELLAGQTVQRGALQLHGLPFVAQRDFDSLLWTCDLNFIRGEDSLCRALWSKLPFIWHIYPQQDAAHHAKLAAFHHDYAGPAALSCFSYLWNGVIAPTAASLDLAWQNLDSALPALKNHGQGQRAKLEALGDLAGNLVRFCEKTANG